MNHQSFIHWWHQDEPQAKWRKGYRMEKERKCKLMCKAWQRSWHVVVLHDCFWDHLTSFIDDVTHDGSSRMNVHINTTEIPMINVNSSGPVWALELQGAKGVPLGHCMRALARRIKREAVAVATTSRQTTTVTPGTDISGWTRAPR